VQDADNTASLIGLSGARAASSRNTFMKTVTYARTGRTSSSVEPPPSPPGTLVCLQLEAKSDQSLIDHNGAFIEQHLNSAQ